ncbi:flagellar motor protein MotB [Clostridium gasigenes]|uniref:OmpA family protein n=1 Tax=Clostridium gasigenes TaxID=94869 RepID=A0A7X0VRG5_9CLOT|nr:flagellar motor protein MotB [Clostridium gasigenes]MBB6714963.1 OmpA family protein [Clostridium gasigenes]
MAKKKEHHEEHVDETWLIPYSDMLTLLLALFIVMFAMSKVDAQKFAKVSASLNSAFVGGTSVLEKGDSGTSTDGTSSIVEGLTSGQIEQESMNQAKSEIEQGINTAGYSDKIEVSVNESGLAINIKDTVLFDSAKADVKKESNPLLMQISQALKGFDNDIKVIGYTDNRPINNGEFRSNWDLSAMRAINTMQFLSQYGDLPEDKLSIEAYGEHKAKYDNSTEEGQSGNRRVEISILRKYPVEDPVSTDINQ